jgi:hypothetical protein
MEDNPLLECSPDGSQKYRTPIQERNKETRVPWAVSANELLSFNLKNKTI